MINQENQNWILHAGPPKTGSSSLQHWLHSQISELRKQGILYPYWGTRHVHHHEIYMASKKYMPNYGHESLEIKPQVVSNLISKIENSMKENYCNAVILSSELLSTLSSTEFNSLISKLRSKEKDIVVLFVSRNKKDFSRSVAEELKKNGDTREFQVLIKMGENLWEHCFKRLIPSLRDQVKIYFLDIDICHQKDLNIQFNDILDAVLKKKVKLLKQFSRLNRALDNSILKQIDVFNKKNYDGLKLDIDFMPQISNPKEIIKKWCDLRSQRESIWIK